MADPGNYYDERAAALDHPATVPDPGPPPDVEEPPVKVYVDEPTARGFRRSGPERATAKRVRIELRAGALPRLVREAEDALLAGNAGIYQRAGLLTRVVRLDEKTAEDAERRSGVNRVAGSVIMMPATTQYLTV